MRHTGKIEEFNKLQTPKQLMSFMNKNIEYGCLGKDGSIYKEDMNIIRKQLQLISVEDMLNNGIGTCLDQVELERMFFANNNYPIKTYAMKVYTDKELKNEETVRVHCVLVFFNNSIPYIFEHSWEDYRDIIEFANLDDVFTHLIHRYEVWAEVLEKGYKYYKIIEYSCPPLGIDFEELKKFTNKYSPVKFGELDDKIVNNKKERSK